MDQKTGSVRHISKCTIKPHRILEESQLQGCYLTPWDIAMLSAHYIQDGLLFTKPQPSSNDPNPTNTFIDQLKQSLSVTLTHFFPLSGRFVTKKQDDPPSFSVQLDCTNFPGAEFIHAVADVNMADILVPIHVPPIVKSFFVLNGAVNHDGHTMPLLAVQVTELLDAIFVACSLNHAIGDGTSFWNFFNAWAEICRAIRRKEGNIECISRPPIIKRWFLEDHEDPTNINLPFSHHDEFIERYKPPPLRERIFHFTPESMAKLKAKANAECNTDNKISSFQALSALMWRSVTRARRLPADQNTSCKLAINNRSRLDPPLSGDYFGNCIQTVRGTTTVGELLNHGLGWAAWMLHEAIVGHTNKKVRGWIEEWMKNPYIYQLGPFFDPFSVMMGNSPTFNMFGCEFGLGRAVAARGGYANKFDGKVSGYPGHDQGRGSVNLEVCLQPDFMSALESDEEFMNAVSPHEVHMLAMFD